MMQNDAGWVPLMFSPIMFPGNPESWNGMASTGTTPVETLPPGAIPFGAFPPGAIPLGAFPPGISPTGTADGIAIPQCIPVLFPVQMPFFLPSPPSNQAGQNAGFHPLPFFGFTGIKFPGPMYVLNT